MKLIPTELPGVVLVDTARHDDDRGWLMESFSAPRFAAAMMALGLPAPPPFVQDNHSGSHAGVLRGLHYQLPPHAQGKLVRVLRGAAFDVAVDLRRASPTFGRWIGVTLSAANRRQLWLPAGCAHGVLALEDHTELLYKTTAVYAPTHERAIAWDDPALGIRWPAMTGGAPRLSARDAAAPRLADAETF